MSPFCGYDTMPEVTCSQRFILTPGFRGFGPAALGLPWLITAGVCGEHGRSAHGQEAKGRKKGPGSTVPSKGMPPSDLDPSLGPSPEGSTTPMAPFWGLSF